MFSLIFSTIDCLIHFVVKWSLIAGALSYVFYQLIRLIPKLIFGSVISAGDKAVLITGCDTGFGHRLALRLNQIGFKVYATVLSPTSSGAQELKVNASQPNRMVVLKMDVTSDEDINKVHEEISQDLEDTSYQLWGVVNNAGIAYSGFLEWGTTDTYRQTFEINTFGAVRVTLRFLPLIRQSKGRLVNVVSVLGRYSLKYTAIYSMSKHSMVAFTDGLRRELKKFGVKVVSIEPSFFRTAITNTESTIKSMRQVFDQSSLEVQNYYRIEEEVKTFREVSKLIPFEGNLDLVVNDMVDAIVSRCPNIVYRPSNKFWKAVTFLMMYLPIGVVDWIVIKLDQFISIETNLD